ncbi:hypothetical protein OU994_20180 [Pseudoduganella sp. SL102]|uniref:hypothetical protein n=1 Tax=Pseudoduganella sp. SL102 TaxID=2995154 RepID=UPI00248C7D34|nr:hypothetical protein [Pseudoduganella sp. SL102]WBS00627.1 hypothetical protein OU994_20180 [Pseudoduganella sp. SL102]
MHIDLETWLIDTGDIVIRKLQDKGSEFLAPVEQAVLWMWDIDYAVRNSGSFGPLQDSSSSAITDFLVFSRQSGLAKLAAFLVTATDEVNFCSHYDENFKEACGELRSLYCECVLECVLNSISTQ